MPELPEVETVARGLSTRVTGDLIESVWLGSKLEPLKSPAAEIAATLEGNTLPGCAAWGNTWCSILNLGMRSQRNPRPHPPNGLFIWE